MLLGLAECNIMIIFKMLSNLLDRSLENDVNAEVRAEQNVHFRSAELGVLTDTTETVYIVLTAELKRQSD